MKYILEGNEKDVSNVLKEQRIRVNRGLISITPITECGLITEEDARKDMEEKLSELMASIADNEKKMSSITDEHNGIMLQVSELEKTVIDKDTLISSLTAECDGLRARVTELESTSIDNKALSMEDSKGLPVADSKAVTFNDEKVVTTEEVKKPGRPRNSNKS